MYNIIQDFHDCLKSEFPCEKIYEKMKNLSNFKITKVPLQNIFVEFMNFCANHFQEELKSYQLNNINFQKTDIYKNIFEVAHQIVLNKNKYNKNENFEIIELFYKTFFFVECTNEDYANGFTFNLKPEDDSIEPNYLEEYLLNVGMAILNGRQSELIEILFSEETPELFINIIMICFEYIRFMKKDISDFINLCVPSLNHYNHYYLFHYLRKDLQYKVKNICQINYIKLEEFIEKLKNPQNEIINEHEQSNNTIVIKSGKIQIKDILNYEEIEKYFCFPKEKDAKAISEFFKEDNLKKNWQKFEEMINLQKKKSIINYQLIYDKSKMEDTNINVFSLPFLLKHQIINKVNENFFQIYNYGNIKIELFSKILKKYLNLMNDFLNQTISNKQKLELENNSGFYKFKEDYVFLVNIDENDVKLFYLAGNLGSIKITSLNEDTEFCAYQVAQSYDSSQIYETEIDDNYEINIDDEALYNFGNYSFEINLRRFIKKAIISNNEVCELPRLLFALNYSIPIKKEEFKFITKIKAKMNKKNSYGYSELDYVLLNKSNKDIVIEQESLSYKEKLLMIFPEKTNLDNNQKMILKKKSIIFFEFKSTFPYYTWKDKFSHFFKKIQKFIEIYTQRGVYKKEYLQIFFVYDHIPEIHFINTMKLYIKNNLSIMFGKFEFGIYYFSRGINILNYEIINNKLLKIENEQKNQENQINEIFNILNSLNNAEINDKIEEIKKKYNWKP